MGGGAVEDSVLFVDLIKNSSSDILSPEVQLSILVDDRLASGALET